ncbi:sensor histidine kinase [Sesbania bispinosa]|nr:sensor histidine kinase [Sesbania bispinosa]
MTHTTINLPSPRPTSSITGTHTAPSLRAHPRLSCCRCRSIVTEEPLSPSSSHRAGGASVPLSCLSCSLPSLSHHRGGGALHRDSLPLRHCNRPPPPRKEG